LVGKWLGMVGKRLGMVGKRLGNGWVGSKKRMGGMVLDYGKKDKNFKNRGGGFFLKSENLKKKLKSLKVRK